ncbi:MAG: efflux RND transporter periplasmic adaptor subunit [Planctomycetes bacterium]|jgi:multidrug efflux system membrane fusion protein|nr:efflux RND transporter periplasmic adaptor subunit [Planctomycetota bacterium]
MKALRLTLQILLPILVLLLGFLAAKKIASLGKPPTIAESTFVGPSVRVVTATATDLRIDVETQGTVEAFRAIDLAADVGGRLITVSPQLRAGGFFAAGDVLAEIDPADYELAITQQEANVARAELRVLQERAESDAATRAWQQLEGQRPADPLAIRTPQIRDAEAALNSAKSQLAQAHLNLQRTKVKAPFAGRVRSARVDTGQIVQPGQSIAEIYGIDFVEIRLPVPSADAAFLDLPMQWNDGEPRSGATVVLAGEFGGAQYQWSGNLVRTEGEIDRRTRQMNVVARVEAPYSKSKEPEADGRPSERPPLAVGMFVKATIHGRVYRDVVALPRAALRSGNEVWVLDAENRLHRRAVEVLRIEADRVLLRSGLKAGEQVNVTALETPTDGMPVRPNKADATMPTPGQGK